MSKHPLPIAEKAYQSPEQALEKALQRVDESPYNARMKSALRLVAQGTPYREAAHEVGYKNQREVYKYSQRLDLLQLHTEQLTDGYRRLAMLSSQELQRRLVEEPEEVTTRDLSVLAGISADKVMRFEGLKKAPASPIDKLFDLLEMQGKLEVKEERTVSFEGKDPVQEAVDVTPAPEAAGSVAPVGSGSEV